MYEVMDHPAAPSMEELGEYLVEPIPPEEIQDKRDAGLTLVEANLLEHEAVDAYIELTDPGDRSMTDIGTVLYRLVQLFGTPQLPEYHAGNDISWRTDDTFKYLFRVLHGVDVRGMSEGDDVAIPDAADEWLVTVFDHRVRLGVGLAKWADSPDATVEVVPEEAVPIMAVVKGGVVEPVECEYGDNWF